MKLLFVKGKRGLAANHNGKFYFPDRNGCIKATGLYDCKITIDKDKFAFVDGKLIKTQATSIETICSLLNLDMSSVGLENRETINVFNVNNVDVLFVKNSISTHLIILVRELLFLQEILLKSIRRHRKNFCMIIIWKEEKKQRQIRCGNRIYISRYFWL